MELKVWVEGIQRVVCGVTEKTTCQDVVYALAHATGRTGRFTLIERWRNSERLLAPMDQPLRVLMKWGEHSSDVHFILQRTPLEPSPSAQNVVSSPLKHKVVNQHNHHQFRSQNASAGKLGLPPSQQQASLPTSHTFPPPLYREPPRMPPPYRDPPPVVDTIPPSSAQSSHMHPNSSDDDTGPRNSARSQFHGVKSPTPMHRRNLIKEFKSHHHSHHHQQQNVSGNSSSSGVPSLNSGPISTRLFPPPPPPQHQFQPSSYRPVPGVPDVVGYSAGPTPVPHPHLRAPPPSHPVALKNLRDLVQDQRSRILAQRAEISKFDGEIEMLDRRVKEVDDVNEEVARLEDILDAHETEVKELRAVEDDAERTRRQEKDLEARLSKLRHQLSSCESELNSGRGKIQSLSEVLAAEQREAEEEDERERRGVEAKELLEEIERQKAASEELRATAERLEEKIQEAERALSEKRKLAADLAQEMRELNLESLRSMPIPVVSPELSRSPTEGLMSKRKIVGSPRQLENAAPTPKNPQGVWV